MNTGAGASLFLTGEHEKLRAMVEQFAREEVAPVMESYTKDKSSYYAIVAKMGELGLFGLPFPEEYGGGGNDHIALCLAIEELARVDSSVAITLSAGVALGTTPIYRFGTEEQKQRWLPPVHGNGWPLLGSPRRAGVLTPPPSTPPPGAKATTGSSTALRRSSRIQGQRSRARHCAGSHRRAG